MFLQDTAFALHLDSKIPGDNWLNLFADICLQVGYKFQAYSVDDHYSFIVLLSVLPLQLGSTLSDWMDRLIFLFPAFLSFI